MVRPHLLWSPRGPYRCETHAGCVPRTAEWGDRALRTGSRAWHALRRVSAVRVLLRRRDAALRDPGARAFPRKDHGQRLRCRRDDRGSRHGPRSAGGRLAIRPVRWVRVAFCRVVGDRHRGGGAGADGATTPSAAGGARGGSLMASCGQRGQYDATVVGDDAPTGWFAFATPAYRQARGDIDNLLR